ncbi:hypothetical protein [Bosea psychrotolerans]|uniref:Uncharacterized protein n=1 Tax=Bosea psychrotolerans TaxID=1871628 RepID=A0A2S4MHV0_9HYPH|nr:hypothetical protein [Bosea psychrotolerans]POR53987.1 hypothetical protein CYD53_10384 [Bosea psychrotolerans]
MREIAFGAVFSLVIAIGAFLIAAWPVPGRPVAAYFRAGTSAAQVAGSVAQAGGNLLQFGPTPALVISLSGRPGYAAQLYRSGAWLVIDGELARLCAGEAWQART